ncbi:MAG TPA: DAK2 domain-containing protein [Clostridia bacterium]|nr:DAK2 domain-containing protein [Clostridia bacterium]HHY05796.1 DAK2 domain-containing protein [Clostridia bacterium]
MKLEKMDGLLWSKLLIASSIYLEEKKQVVDTLNVFPVPDGDTGTNMSLTMVSAAKALKEKKEKEIGQATKLMAHGALMGARGNSGVILSQLLAGFAKSTEGQKEIDAQGFCQALALAVETAYKAVMNPVEGTILTVSREASQAAMNELKNEDSSLHSVFQATYRGAYEALQKTPLMLSVLQQAGVVDAGGQGLVYILEGMLVALDNNLLKEPIPSFFVPDMVPKEADVAEEKVLAYQYCTEFILKKKKKDLPLEEIKTFLADKGDCVLVVGSSETGKVHIHTNSPGKVLDYCTGLGTLHQIKIDNMSEQSGEMSIKGKVVKQLGIITVSFGTGLNDVFRSLGVDVVIEGGQTMNPSTQEFINAIEQVLAEEVIILPNNSNVILAAQQAASVASKPTKVVATKTIPQGIAALMVYNAENDLDINKKKMEEACQQIVTLEITYAVRDAQYEDHLIKKGQILGLGEGELIITGSKLEDVAEQLINRFLQPEHELVTVYYGADLQEKDAAKMVEVLSEKYTQLDFELHYGGQPLYYYLISLE